LLHASVALVVRGQWSGRRSLFSVSSSLFSPTSDLQLDYDYDYEHEHEFLIRALSFLRHSSFVLRHCLPLFSLDVLAH